MDIRKEIGGRLEDAINKFVDTKLKDIGKDQVKELAHKYVDQLIDAQWPKVTDFVGGYLRKLIDGIDGEKDVVDAPATPATPAESPVMTSEEVKS